MKFSTLLPAKFASRKNAGQFSKRAADKRNAPRARVLNLEALESRELLDASPIASLAAASASEDAALVCAAVLDETAAIDLSGAESEPTTWVVNSVEDSATTNGTLRYALTNAQDGDTITFNASTFETMQTIELSGTDLRITKSVTIVGPAAGVTLDAHGASRVFNIVSGAGNVSISGLTIANGYAGTGSGGGIYSGASNVLTVDNCVFTENRTASTSNYYGGGIYAASTVTVNNSSFSGNYAYRGGSAIYVSAQNSLTISNCEITEQVEIGQRGLLNVVDCSFHDGKSAILADSASQVTVSGSQFANNSVAIKVSAGLSAEYQTSLTVSDSAFTSNTGAISVDGKATVKIENGCEFANNTSYTLAVGSESTVTVSDSNFIGNKSTGEGGAIRISANDSSTFSQLTVSGCAFTDNRASSLGGAISIKGGKLGAITLVVEDSTFTSNESYSSGGAIAIDVGSAASVALDSTITNSTFASNHANNGGAIHCRAYGNGSGAKSFVVTGSAFTENRADDYEDGDGGAINFPYQSGLVNGVDARIENTTFDFNSAMSGGAIRNLSAKLTLAQVAMRSNSAYFSGGALYSSYGEFTGTNVLIVDNTANNSGGGVYLYLNGAPSYLYNATIAKNTAKTGGGIYNAKLLEVTNSIVAENTATDGADVWTRDDAGARTALRATLVRDASHQTGIDVETIGDMNKVGTATAPIEAGFVSSANAGYHLKNDSVAVNAGDSDFVTVDVDLDGNPRVVDGVVDLGAYEYTTPLEPQQLPRPVVNSTSVGSTTITVAWDAVPNAERYNVYYKIDGATTWTGVSAKTATSCTISELEPNTTYCVRVQARGNGVNYKNSAYSATVTLTTNDIVPLTEPIFTLTPDVTTVTVNWLAVPNATKYAVYWKLPTDTTWRPRMVYRPNTSFTIPALSPDTTYEVRMRAFGDGVNYLNSELRDSGDRVKTLPYVVPTEKLATPTGAAVSAKTATTITASWNPVPNATGYQFAWKNETDSAYKTVNLGANVTSYRITRLVTSATYSWKALALGDGVNYLDSDYCATVVDQPQQTLETPKITSAEMLDTTINLTWTGDPDAAGYRIMYKASSDSSYTTINVDGGATASYTITGLDPNLNHILKIASIGDGIDYKSSAYTSLVTLLPTGPSKLATPVISSFASTAGTITVNWDAVVNASSYTILCGGEKCADVPASATSYTISDLNPSTSYTIKVQAIAASAANNSDPAAKIIKTTALTKLATPTLTVSATTGKTAALTWTAPTNGDVVGYLLAYRPTSSAAYTSVLLNADATSYTLTGLTQNTTYKFKILAIGDMVETTTSPYSAIRTGTTTSAASAILDLGEELFDELEDDYDLLAENFVA